MEIGLHICDYTWTGGDDQIGPRLAQHAKGAEDAGVRRISVMDHLWQIGLYGPPEHAMLEAYSALAFMAAHTRSVRLHTLVTAAVYREPGLLAKLVSTLDVLSQGRAGLGLGAAWFEDEALGLGLPFPGLSERFDRLEETIRVCLQMWSDSEEPFEGEHYSLGRTLNSPQPLRGRRPYLMVGGGGEKKTLRLVAQYADACNLTPMPGVERKLDVLRAHCDDLGRPFGEIDLTTMVLLQPDETADDLRAELERVRGLGFDAAYVCAVGRNEPSQVIDILSDVVPHFA